MRRRLFTLTSALSLVLFVATLLLVTGGLGGDVVLRDGGATVGHGSAVATYALVVNARLIGIGWTHSDVWFEGMIGVPTWVLSLVLAILPLTWVIASVRQKKHTRFSMSCAQCGYDLRATPDRCPECGAVPAKSSGVRV